MDTTNGSTDIYVLAIRIEILDLWYFNVTSDNALGSTLRNRIK